jgi:diacylglycerol O-acyltransferase / wax synthase
MPTLSAMDLAMFMLESPERPFNIGPLVLLRPPAGAASGAFADKLQSRLLKRPPGPPFSYQLKMSLLKAPAVEPMARPDLKRHVHRLTLDSASMPQLLDKVCDLHEPLLDRSGLLWQFWIIDGLADGRVALYGKVHHGIIDGRTFVKAVTQWLSTDAKDKTVRAMWDGFERSGGAGRQRAGLLQQLMKGRELLTGTLRSGVGMAGLLAEQGLRSAGLGKGLPLPFLKVPGVFEGRLSAKRSFAWCTLPLREMKALGKPHGATVNDLLLTVLDMAMHGYLAERGQAITGPLVADMPVALAAGAKGGNQIAVLQFPLGAGDASVLQRLKKIRAETGQLKQSLGQRGSDTVMLYTTLVHALPILVERIAAKAAPMHSNLLVSNPFGVDGPRWLMGAQVELVLPVSVVAAGHKLNVTAVSLGERLQLGFLAMPDAVPQLERLAQLTELAFDELAAALAPAQERSPKPRVPAKRKRAPTSGQSRKTALPPGTRRANASPPPLRRAAPMSRKNKAAPPA